MSLANYTDLLASVADRAARSDLTSVIPDFVSLTEAMIQYGDAGQDIEPLRIREMEAKATTAPSSGDITLATDFLEMKRVTYTSNPRVVLEYASPETLDGLYGTTDAGCPAFFTVIGSTLSIRPTGSSSVEYTYYQKIPGLQANATNWLMTKAPTVYLYGCMFHEGVYSQNPQSAAAYLGLYRNAILGLERADHMIKGGSFAVRASSPAW